MAVELIVAPEAERDLREAFAWYEARQPGLGEGFLSCVDACVQSILRAPRARAKVHLHYRRALVRRFPYAVFYECADRAVTIYGVFHASRDPKKWRSRLP